MDRYSIVKTEVEKRITDDFKTDFFIKRQYDHPCPAELFNFNPYVMNGEVLPDEIRLIGKKWRTIHAC